MKFQDSREFAEKLDAEDTLAGFRERFHIPVHATGQESLYFCGHSLGLQPKSAADFIVDELSDWQHLGVRGHFEAKRPWLPYHKFLTDLTARLVGACGKEVVNMNTLTVNLHLMMVSFYRPTTDRHKILIETPAFPSDHYAVWSQIRFHGFNPDSSLLTIGPRNGESSIRTEDLDRMIEREGSEMALILLPGVQYYSGQAFDIEHIASVGHKAGCKVGFDLAHAVGNLPLQLHDSGIDFAVWCNYKYLNSGPGAVGGCFVHERHSNSVELPRFAGWWGQDKATRFEMGPDFHPIPGVEGWQVSNPPIFSLAPVLASLEVFDEAGMPALQCKSQRLTGFLEFLLDTRLASRVQILTPRDPAARGCQLSLRIDGGDRSVYEALEKLGVVCDWREPDVIRVAPVPLYNRFTEVFEYVGVLQQILEEDQ
ncbi:MAG: kynureninase [Gammaproteobacteria bacterium]